MFESGQGFNESWQGTYSAVSSEYTHESTNVGIAHAPLILPHFSADVQPVIDYEGSIHNAIEICDQLGQRGLLSQADLDASSNLSDVIEHRFSSLFSGLNLDEVEINLEGVRTYTKDGKDKVKVVVEAFHYELGAYYIGGAIKYLNKREAGLGESFSRLVCTAVGRLYRGWSPYQAWNHLMVTEWRCCDTYEQFAEEILEEMDGEEEELLEMNVLKTKDAIKGLGGEITAFYIHEREMSAFIEEMKAKLALFGKYKTVVEAMLTVLTDVTFGMDEFTDQYRSKVDDDSENGFGFTEIAIFAKKDSVFDHLYDQHMQGLYEVGTDENAVSMGWMLDNISEEEVIDMVAKLQFLLEKRAWFADVFNAAFEKESWS